MRIIPQVLRQYLVANTYRSVTIESLLDNCNSFTTLLHLKRLMLHDKKKTLMSIDATIDEIANDQFHFLYLTKKEQGKEYDPARLFEEDLAGATYTKWELLKVCRDLKAWVQEQPAYRYPSEINA